MLGLWGTGENNGDRFEKRMCLSLGDALETEPPEEPHAALRDAMPAAFLSSCSSLPRVVVILHVCRGLTLLVCVLPVCRRGGTSSVFSS